MCVRMRVRAIARFMQIPRKYVYGCGAGAVKSVQACGGAWEILNRGDLKYKSEENVVS